MGPILATKFTRIPLGQLKRRSYVIPRTTKYGSHSVKAAIIDCSDFTRFAECVPPEMSQTQSNKSYMSTCQPINCIIFFYF